MCRMALVHSDMCASHRVPALPSTLTAVRPKTPADRVHHLFLALSLRHLCVVDWQSRCRGIITRKDLDHAAGTGPWRCAVMVVRGGALWVCALRCKGAGQAVPVVGSGFADPGAQLSSGCRALNPLGTPYPIHLPQGCPVGALPAPLAARIRRRRLPSWLRLELRGHCPLPGRPAPPHTRGIHPALLAAAAVGAGGQRQQRQLPPGGGRLAEQQPEAECRGASLSPCAQRCGAAGAASDCVWKWCAQ